MLNLFCTKEGFKLFKRNQLNFDFFLASTCFNSLVFQYQGMNSLVLTNQAWKFPHKKKEEIKMISIFKSQHAEKRIFGSQESGWFPQGRANHYSFVEILQQGVPKSLRKRRVEIPGHSLGHRGFLPLCACPRQALSEIKGHRYEQQSMPKFKHDSKKKTIMLWSHCCPQDILWNISFRDKPYSP